MAWELAETWLHKDLTEQDIVNIANYQVASSEMVATPLHQDFLKRENPHEAVLQDGRPELIAIRKGSSSLS